MFLRSDVITVSAKLMGPAASGLRLNAGVENSD